MKVAAVTPWDAIVMQLIRKKWVGKGWDKKLVW